jgi:hypothetical protein
MDGSEPIIVSNPKTMKASHSIKVTQKKKASHELQVTQKSKAITKTTKNQQQ